MPTSAADYSPECLGCEAYHSESEGDRAAEGFVAVSVVLARTVAGSVPGMQRGAPGYLQAAVR